MKTKNIEKLIILNYASRQVHIYMVDSSADIDEEYIEKLGHNADECSWMFAEDIEIISHKGILL